MIRDPILQHLTSVCRDVDREAVSERPTEVGVTLQLPPIGGRFQPLGVLGEGGMAVVYRALDLETGEEVALKLPNLVGKYVDRRFELEGHALDAVRSPSIAGFVGRGTPDAPFIAMELVRGQSLAKRIIHGGRLSPEATVAIGRRVAAALSVIHLGGWVHRDIKPGNIVLTLEGSARLVDFGLARSVEGSGAGTSTGQFVGTLSYLAPEQLSQGRVVDARCDVFALGCVLFEMITAQSAFRRSMESIFRGEWSEKNHPRLLTEAPSIPRPIGALIDRLTAIDPSARPRDGLDALAALLALDPTFQAASIEGGVDQTVREIISSALGGAVVVTGAAGAGKSRAARAAADYLAEIFAPSAVVSLRCNPSIGRSTGAHLPPLERLLRKEGFARAADVLAGDAAAEATDGDEPTFVLFVDDASFLDALSLERILRLSERRLGRVVLTARPGARLPGSLREVRARRASASKRTPLDALSDTERALLRAAASLGTTFAARRISMLHAPTAEETLVGRDLDRLVEGGILEWIGPEQLAFRQASTWEHVVSAVEASELRSWVAAAQRVEAKVGPAEAVVSLERCTSGTYETGTPPPPR